ncbi:MAG TPA: hypothetical protein VH934_11330 [Xanthobacteraceae bacterium]|jgi:hypothetical protein
MQLARSKTLKRALAAGFGAAAICAALQAQPASAQDPSGARTISAHSETAGKAIYYVDFRARTAASYGHAFVWYGRADQRTVEVAGVHPATESVIPYILGHVIPVPAETGKSYGDLDEQYLTASYRVYMTEAQAREVFAYIKHLEAASVVWNAATWNCVAFIQTVAMHMGLRVPGNHLLYPEEWVNELRQLNGGRRYMPGAQPMTQQASAPAAHRPATAARKPARPAPSQVVDANPRT